MRWPRVQEYRVHITLFLVIFAIVAYVYYIRQPAFDWGQPTVASPEVRAGEPFRVDFTVQSKDNCLATITRYAERKLPNGALVLLPPLAFEQKLIRAVPGVRKSFFTVMFPAGTEPYTYRVFSRVRSDCVWLDYLWPRVIDTDWVEVTVTP